MFAVARARCVSWPRGQVESHSFFLLSWSRRRGAGAGGGLSLGRFTKECCSSPIFTVYGGCCSFINKKERPSWGGTWKENGAISKAHFLLETQPTSLSSQVLTSVAVAFPRLQKPARNAWKNYPALGQYPFIVTREIRCEAASYFRLEAAERQNSRLGQQQQPQHHHKALPEGSAHWKCSHHYVLVLPSL